MIIIVIAFIARNNKKFSCRIPNRRGLEKAACECCRTIGSLLPLEDRLSSDLRLITYSQNPQRLCKALRERYGGLPIIVVEDALYANAPHLRQITGYGWRYVINIKPDSHKSLEKQFARRRANGRVKELEITEVGGVRHYFAWDSNLWLCESAPDVTVKSRWW